MYMYRRIYLSHMCIQLTCVLRARINTNIHTCMHTSIIIPMIMYMYVQHIYIHMSTHDAHIHMYIYTDVCIYIYIYIYIYMSTLFEEQQAEIEKYRQYLHLVFKAGVSMLPLHRVTRRRRSVAGVKVGRGVFWSEMDWISDPSFQYAAIAAHEFVWQDLRKSGPSGSPNASGSEVNYGRDILMVVPKSLPDEYTILTERPAQPLPDHLVSDLPKPQADTVRNILNRIEGHQSW